MISLLRPTQQVTMVRTRNVPPLKCGQPSVLGSTELRLMMPDTAIWGAEKLPPPSVDLTNLIVPTPAVQKIYRWPDEFMAISGEKESKAKLAPAADEAAVPVQFAP